MGQEPVEPDRNAEVEASDALNPVAAKEELASVKDVLQFLIKASRTLKLYMHNNPIHQKFLKELQEKFSAHLGQYHQMPVQVKQFQFLFGEEVIYENTNRVESLALRLYVDGIREVSFHEGLELAEIVDFLEALGRDAASAQADDDLATILWEKGFAHISYLISEEDLPSNEELSVKESSDGDLAQAFQKEVGSTQAAPEAAVASAVSQEAQAIEIKKPDLTYHNIYSLSDEEISKIKNDMQVEADKDLLGEMIQILTAILQIEQETKDCEEVVKILEEMLDLMINRGDLFHACRILESFRGLLEGEVKMPTRHQALLQAAIERAGSVERIQNIRGMLNAGEAKDPDQFHHYVVLLHANAVKPLIDLLGTLNRMKPRRMLCEALAELAKDEVSILAHRLNDPNWFVVRNIINILGKIGKESVVEFLIPLIDHPELRVRKELIRVLEVLPGTQAKESLARFLWDEDRALRIQAARSLARWKVAEASGILLEVIKASDFAQRDFFEKKEIFDALGRVGEEDIIPFLRQILKKSSWFQFSGRAKLEELRLCAVMALKRMKTSEAIEVLREGAALRNKAVCQACKRVLKEIEADGGKQIE